MPLNGYENSDSNSKNADAVTVSARNGGADDTGSLADA